MKKEDKALIIAKIGEELAKYSCVYLTQTSGLNAEKTSQLRRACFGADVKMLCVKDTLLKKAFEASETDYSGLYDLLHGETTLLLCNVGNAPAKLIKKFRNTFRRRSSENQACYSNRICINGSFIYFR